MRLPEGRRVLTRIRFTPAHCLNRIPSWPPSKVCDQRRNISLPTRLVDTITTPMLLKIVESGKLVTHRFAMNDIMKAYDMFGNA
jgi:hypothetical protein